MALDDSYTIVRPGQVNGTGAINETHIEEFTGLVQGTMERRSAFAPLIPVRKLVGTSILTNFAVGQSTIQAITPGTPIDGSVTKFGKAQVEVKTALIARAVLPLLETFQTSYNARAEIAMEHGKALAKQHDQAFAIQAAKAGRLTANTFGLTAAGHTGGSQVTLAAAGDALDPSKLYTAVLDLLTQMRLKDIDPLDDGVIVALGPVEMQTLMMNELLINSEFITSEGTNIRGWMLKAAGVQVVQSNNFVGGQNIATNVMGADYTGDFTKLVATAFAPKALLAAETIALQSKVWFDDKDKQWFVDSWRSYAVGPSVAAFAGTIEKP